MTESFDLSRSPEEARQATKDGTAWVDAITETLERLEHVLTPAESPLVADGGGFPAARGKTTGASLLGPQQRYLAVHDRTQRPDGSVSCLA